MKLEAEGLRKPIRVSRKGPEQHATDDGIMKMRNQKETVVQNEVGRRNRHQDPGHSANHECDHESDRPIDWGSEANVPSVQSEEPIEDLHSRWYGNDHGRDAKERIHVRTRAHGKKMMEP